MNAPISQKPVGPEDLEARQRPVLHTYRSWQRFHAGPRQEARPLTSALAAFPDAVLVAGCQRSGTTMLTRVIARSRGFRSLQLTHDDELDAALALGGYIDLPRDTRYCFQTTYLNERFPEYRTLGPDQRLIWVLRNPHSVVYSMVYNWRRWALNELYESSLEQAAQRVPEAVAHPAGWWPFGPSRAHKAMVAYVGKSAQLFEIRKLVPPAQLMVVEYDEVVQSPAEWLPRIFSFIRQPYDPAYAQMIRAASVHKADRMPDSMRRQIDTIAMPTYEECLRLPRGTAAAA
ncbi:MAG: sulfotransferase [Gammaproteobacteria bacterium]